MKRLLTLCLAGLLALAAQALPFVAFDTAKLAVTATAQNLTLPTTTSSGAVSQPTSAGVRQVVLTAIGTQTVFVRCATDGVAATTSNSLPVMANSQIVVSLGVPVTVCSAIAAGSGSTLYATVGVGE